MKVDVKARLMNSLKNNVHHFRSIELPYCDNTINSLSFYSSLTLLKSKLSSNCLFHTHQKSVTHQTNKIQLELHNDRYTSRLIVFLCIFIAWLKFKSILFMFLHHRDFFFFLCRWYSLTLAPIHTYIRLSFRLKYSQNELQWTSLVSFSTIRSPAHLRY